MRLLKTILTAATLLLTFGVQAATRPLEAGSDYEEMAAIGSDKPVIYEFFNYGCPHCYQFQPFVDQFKKANPDIEFKYFAIDIHPAWAIYSKAYYLADLLKVKDTMHAKIFHRVQVERKPIANEADLLDFFAANGVDRAKAEKALKSFALQAKMRQAKQMAKKFKVLGTPTFIVNERFKLNNSKLGSMEMIEKALLELSKKTGK